MEEINVTPKIPEVQEETQEKKSFSKKQICLGIAALVVTILLGAAAVYYKDTLMDSAYIQSWGLLGVLIVAFIAGSTVSVTMIPVPYWILVITLPTVLAGQWGVMAPIWVALVSAAGCTIGHIPTFMIGYGGRDLSEKLSAKLSPRLSRLYNRSVAWAKKHGTWAVFIQSSIPNPVHLPMTIAIGTLRYPLPKFIIVSFLGNTVKSLVLAFCGYYGIEWVTNLLGI